MKKEVFLAVTMGFLLGLVITFGIWTANKSLKNLPQLAQSSPTPPAQTSPSVNPQPTTTTPSTGTISLAISAPPDEALLDKNSVSISGKTSPAAAVSIIYELGEQVVQANATGDFSANINLEGGYNRVIITAYDSQGNTTSQSLTLTYTTAKI